MKTNCYPSPTHIYSHMHEECASTQSRRVCLFTRFRWFGFISDHGSFLLLFLCVDYYEGTKMCMLIVITFVNWCCVFVAPILTFNCCLIPFIIAGGFITWSRSVSKAITMDWKTVFYLKLSQPRINKNSISMSTVRDFTDMCVCVRVCSCLCLSLMGAGNAPSVCGKFTCRGVVD